MPEIHQWLNAVLVAHDWYHVSCVSVPEEVDDSSIVKAASHNYSSLSAIAPGISNKFNCWVHEASQNLRY